MWALSFFFSIINYVINLLDTHNYFRFWCFTEIVSGFRCEQHRTSHFNAH